MQVCCSDKAGQLVPPMEGCTTTLRECVIVPPPQLSLHPVHAAHSEVTQSVGHGCVLQGVDSTIRAHPEPPADCGCCTLRERYLSPVAPHVTVQTPKEVQVVTTHGTGQVCVLHEACSCTAGHATPLPDGCFATTRLRVMEPVPHVVLHSDHSAQSVTSQFTSHGAMVHVLGSSIASHGGAPYCATTRIIRVRTCSPAPHPALHMPHAPHGDSEHATGHSATLHSRPCVSDRHEAPK